MKAGPLLAPPLLAVAFASMVYAQVAQSSQSRKTLGQSTLGQTNDDIRGANSGEKILTRSLRTETPSTSSRETPAPDVEGRQEPSPQSKTVFDILGIVTNILLVLVTYLLVLLARSSDKAYRRIADVAAGLAEISDKQLAAYLRIADVAAGLAEISGKQLAVDTQLADISREQADIAQRQLKILAASDEPIFRARTETLLRAGIVVADSLIIENAGSPVSEVTIRHAQIFKVRFWGRIGKDVVEKYFGTIGYYPGDSTTNSPGTKVYETIFSESRPLVTKLHRPPERQFNGYKVLVDFFQYVRIGYSTRAERDRIRWFMVDDFGCREVSKEEGDRQLDLVSKSMASDTLFVFYSMDEEKFWEIVERLAATL